MKPSKGQIIVTEKVAHFLHNPVVTVRQTDEGGVMVGDSQEDWASTRWCVTRWSRSWPSEPSACSRSWRA